MFAGLITVFVILSLVANWHTVATWPKSTFGWATDHASFLVIGAIVIFYLGAFVYFISSRSFGSLYAANEKFWYKPSWPISQTANEIADRYNLHLKDWVYETGLKIIWIGLICFVLTTFPLSNHFGLLKGWLIALGFITIALVEIRILQKIIKNADANWNNDDYKPSNWLVWAFMLIPVLASYYLDIFLFSWKNPWITAVLLVILAIFHSYMFYQKKSIKRKEQEETERRNKALEKRMVDLSHERCYSLAMQYLNAKKKNNETESELILTTIKGLVVDDNNRLKGLEIKKLVAKMEFANFAMAPEILALVLDELTIEDVSIILSFNTAYYFNETELPLFFKYSKDKKDILKRFCEKLMDPNIILNKTKQQFRFRAFVSIINSLEFGYEKEWSDEEWIKNIVLNIEHILNLTTEFLPKIWNKVEASQLEAYLQKTKKKYEDSGIQVKFPEIPII
jgi:hypothetical protein